MSGYERISVLVTGVCLVLSLSMMSCQDQRPDPDYIQSVEEWHQNRLQRLTRAIGWTTLVGLEWLPEGRSSFGTCDTCDINLSSGASALIGTWEIQEDSIYLLPAPGISIAKNGEPFPGGTVQTDEDDEADFFNHDALYWTVIFRGGKYAVRIWDTLYQHRYAVDSIPRYPVDRTFAVEATFQPPVPRDSVVIDNALGFQQSLPVAGYIEGEVRGETFRLTALDGGLDQLFMIFADLTTDLETYSGGRYTYIARPDSSGTVMLDFNLAYNPPCVFTEYATCLLPPKDNFIAAHIRAGEKDFSLHH